MIHDISQSLVATVWLLDASHGVMGVSMTTQPYLDVGELAQVSIHGDESMIDQLLVVVSPQLITVLQHASTKKQKKRSLKPLGEPLIQKLFQEHVVRGQFKQPLERYANM